MDAVFLKILNMSLTASYVIVFVLAARLFLKRAPKIFSYALWSAALFRLICPISFTGVFSLFFMREAPIPANIGLAAAPRVATGFAPVDSLVNPILAAQAPPVDTVASVNPLQVWIFLGRCLWLLGIGALLAYSVISLLRLRRRLTGAVLLEGNVYLADRIASPFVLGVLRPKIYLPALPEREQDYILAHERTHIKRGDHVVKLAAFLTLCIHWFNPLVWLAFYLCGQDMEQSCDEAVLRGMADDIRQDYSASLLGLATGRRFAIRPPLAFGEGDTRVRIKNVMRYKKPAVWVSVAALVMVVAVCASLVANRPPNPGAQGDAMEGIWVVGTPPLDEAPVVYQYYFALPVAYRNKVTRQTVGPTYGSGLFEVHHTASMETYGGLMFRIVQHTPAEFEDYWPGQDSVGGVVHFAKNDDYYFSCEFPTDVQSAPEVRDEYEALMAWHDTVLDWFIEDNGLTPYDHDAAVYALEYTYPGEHAFYQITLGSDDAFTAVLSKPVRQGEGGIWCVERMIQNENGGLHYVMPDTDLTAAEYYAQLQAEADAGTAPDWLFDPAAVGQEYFDRVWNWYPVHVKASALTYSD